MRKFYTFTLFTVTLLICNSCYLLLTAGAQAAKEGVQNAKEKNEAMKQESQGMTSELHKANIGKIVFSNTEIAFQAEDPSTFIMEYKAGEELYTRAYFEKSLYDTYLENNPDGKLGDFTEKRNYYIDDELVVSRISNDATGEYKVVNTTFSSPLITTRKPRYVMEQDIIDAMKHPKMAKPGTYTLRVDVELIDTKEEKTIKKMSEGILKINVGSAEDWKDNSGVYTVMPKNPELEKEMLKAIDDFAYNSGWKEQFQRVVATTGEFFVVKQEYSGIPLRKVVEGLAYATWPDGHCTQQYFNFAYDYEGGGVYSTKLYRSATGDQKNVPCSIVK